MGPRKNCLWEFWSLGVWWSVWSLADKYLLTHSPYAELFVLGTLAVIAGLVKLHRWIREVSRRLWFTGRRAMYSVKIEASGAEVDAVQVLEVV